MPDTSLCWRYDHSGVSSHWFHIWSIETDIGAGIRALWVAEGAQIFYGWVVEVAENNQWDWGVQAGEHHRESHNWYGEEPHEQEDEWLIQDIRYRLSRWETCYHWEWCDVYCEEWNCLELENN